MCQLTKHVTYNKSFKCKKNIAQHINSQEHQKSDKTKDLQEHSEINRKRVLKLIISSSPKICFDWAPLQHNFLLHNQTNLFRQTSIKQIKEKQVQIKLGKKSFKKKKKKTILILWYELIRSPNDSSPTANILGGSGISIIWMGKEKVEVRN